VNAPGGGCECGRCVLRLVYLAADGDDRRGAGAGPLPVE
jgi:hypothetical protein